MYQSVRLRYQASKGDAYHVREASYTLLSPSDTLFSTKSRSQAKLITSIRTKEDESSHLLTVNAKRISKWMSRQCSQWFTYNRVCEPSSA